ncbi:MAG TPA: DUF433 domain-containing protein [Polyangiaceae bacterium]|nr:DUF433 domain-containing protein [Polyangiaceae bacterium]
MTTKTPAVELPIVLVPHPHVRVDKKILNGSPHVAGSKVPVRRLWAFYRNGAGVDVLLKRFPRLGPAKIFDALAFAFDNPEVIEADLARENELLSQEQTTSKPITQMDLPFSAKRAARR